MPQLKILIVGAGIAGPSLAFWLSKLPVRITLIERSSSARHTGQQVDLRGHGVTVMRKMGIEAQVREKFAGELGTLIVDAQGRKRAYFKAKRDGRGDGSVTSEFEIMRGELCGILGGLIQGKGVELRYGTKLEEMRETEEGVVVKFEGGDEEGFDMVVGCDGVRSGVRRMIFGEDGWKGVGGAIAWATIPRENGDTNAFTVFTAPGRRVLGSRMDKEDCLRAYFIAGGLEEGHPILTAVNEGNVAEQKAAFVEHFKGVGWQGERFAREVVESPLADDWHAAEMGQVRIDEWTKGRVALLGDAAYCPSVAGWGTAMAMVGAYVLAGEIAKGCGLHPGTELSQEELAKARASIPAALKAYDAVLRPLVTKVQKAGNAGEGLPNSKLAVEASMLIAGLVEMLHLDAFMMRVVNGGGTDFGWQFPEYQQLS